MISIGEYRQIVSELLDELPQEFFRELTGGVIVSPAAEVPGKRSLYHGAVPAQLRHPADRPVQGLL